MCFFRRDHVAGILLLLTFTLSAQETASNASIATGTAQESVEAEARPSELKKLRRRLAVLLSDGKMEEAIRTLEDDIRKARRLGEPPFEVARALNDLGTFYQDLYRLPDALRCYAEALALQRKCCPASPGIVVTLNNVARLRLVQARFAEAEKNYREAERLALRQPALDTAGLAQTYLGLAEILVYTHRYDEAQASARKVLSLTMDSVDEASGAALFLLARVAALQGDRDAAEQLIRRALDSWRVSVGEGHASYASGLAGLATLLSSKEPAEAETLFTKALRIVEVVLGRNHYFYAQLALQYSAHLESHGRKKERTELMEWAKTILGEHRLRNGLGFTVDVQALPNQK